MGKYMQDAQALLPLVGGKENISAVTHCVTRMRFVLVDPARAQVDKIEEVACVKGTFTQAGQFQVIIGNDVAEFYNDFTAVSGSRAFPRRRLSRRRVATRIRCSAPWASWARSSPRLSPR